MQHLVGRDFLVDRKCSRVLRGYVLSLCAVRDIGGWMYGSEASRWGHFVPVAMVMVRGIGS